MELESEVEEAWAATDSATDWDSLASKAAHSVAQTVSELDNPRLSTSLLFTSDERIHALNREWRDRDKPTNVLSFPMVERAELLELGKDGPPVMLGDIALAFETCAREAAEKDIAIADHTAHLIIHGLLHLAGYDHEISREDAEAMEKLEVKALALMGIADPYMLADTE